jgi:thiol-disulfide isomerase/thioredoxin
MRRMFLAGVLLAAAAAFAQEVPRPSPEFIVTLPGGKPLSIQSLRGKVVALVFVSTTCPHCQKFTGDLNAIQREYGAQGVQVVECAFNTGVNEAQLQEFIARFRPSFPTGISQSPAVLSYLQYSSVRIPYVPHLVLIDRQGVIRGDWAGESPFMTNAGANLRAELNKLLAAHAVRGN